MYLYMACNGIYYYVITNKDIYYYVITNNVIYYYVTTYNVIYYYVITYNVILFFCVRMGKCCHACPVTRITGLCGTRADFVAIPTKNPSSSCLCFEHRQPR